MINLFKTNPEKASAKIRINNSLIGVLFTIFGIIWAVNPSKLNFWLTLQFVLAMPLLYISNITYTKIAYRKEAHLWDFFGWITGNTAMALVLNIFGILIYILGFISLFYFYFGLIWGLLFIYTILNTRQAKKPIIGVFKFLYFVLIQIIFGLILIRFY